MMNSSKNNSDCSMDSADHLFVEAARVLDDDESPVDSLTLPKAGETPTIPNGKRNCQPLWMGEKGFVH